MIRLIKRYGGGSRKLYDTEESRYVSLEEIAGWVRQGQQVQVVDSAGGSDVTAQVLAQVIYETHKSGAAMLGVDFLHQAIRRGSRAITDGVGRIQTGVDRIVRRGVEKLPGAHVARAELDALRGSLHALEQSITNLEKTADGKRARTRSGKGKSAARRPRR